MEPEDLFRVKGIRFKQAADLCIDGHAFGDLVKRTVSDKLG